MFYTQYGVYFEAQSHWILRDSNPGPLGLKSKVTVVYLLPIFCTKSLFFQLVMEKMCKTLKKMITSRDQCAKHSFAGWNTQHLYAKVFDDDGCFSLSHVVNESFDEGEKSSHVLIRRLDHFILTYLCSSFIKTTTQNWF